MGRLQRLVLAEMGVLLLLLVPGYASQYAVGPDPISVTLSPDFVLVYGLGALPLMTLVLFLRKVMVRWGVPPFPVGGVREVRPGRVLVTLLGMGVLVGSWALVFQDIRPDEVLPFRMTSSFFPLWAFLFSLITGYWEEVVFRGYVMGRLTVLGAPGWVATGLSALLFAMGHLYEGGWYGGGFTFLLGLFLGVRYARGGNIHEVAWAHALYNMGVLALLWLGGR